MSSPRTKSPARSKATLPTGSFSIRFKQGDRNEQPWLDLVVGDLAACMSENMISKTPTTKEKYKQSSPRDRRAYLSSDSPESMVTTAECRRPRIMIRGKPSKSPTRVVLRTRKRKPLEASAGNAGQRTSSPSALGLKGLPSSKAYSGATPKPFIVPNSSNAALSPLELPPPALFAHQESNTQSGKEDLESRIRLALSGGRCTLVTTRDDKRDPAILLCGPVTPSKQANDWRSRKNRDVIQAFGKTIHGPKIYRLQELLKLKDKANNAIIRFADTQNLVQIWKNVRKKKASVHPFEHSLHPVRGGWSAVPTRTYVGYSIKKSRQPFNSKSEGACDSSSDVVETVKTFAEKEKSSSGIAIKGLDPRAREFCTMRDRTPESDTNRNGAAMQLFIPKKRRSRLPLGTILKENLSPVHPGRFETFAPPGIASPPTSVDEGSVEQDNAYFRRFPKNASPANTPTWNCTIGRHLNGQPEYTRTITSYVQPLIGHSQIPAQSSPLVEGHVSPQHVFDGNFQDHPLPFLGCPPTSGPSVRIDEGEFRLHLAYTGILPSNPPALFVYNDVTGPLIPVEECYIKPLPNYVRPIYPPSVIAGLSSPQPWLPCPSIPKEEDSGRVAYAGHQSVASDLLSSFIAMYPKTGLRSIPPLTEKGKKAAEIQQSLEFLLLLQKEKKALEKV